MWSAVMRRRRVNGMTLSPSLRLVRGDLERAEADARDRRDEAAARAAPSADSRVAAFTICASLLRAPRGRRRFGGRAVAPRASDVVLRDATVLAACPGPTRDRRRARAPLCAPTATRAGHAARRWEAAGRPRASARSSCDPTRARRPLRSARRPSSRRRRRPPWRAASRRALRRRGDLGVGLVGRDGEERLPLRDDVALADEPLADGAFGDALTELRKRDVDEHDGPAVLSPLAEARDEVSVGPVNVGQQIGATKRLSRSRSSVSSANGAGSSGRPSITSSASSRRTLHTAYTKRPPGRTCDAAAAAIARCDFVRSVSEVCGRRRELGPSPHRARSGARRVDEHGVVRSADFARADGPVHGVRRARRHAEAREVLAEPVELARIAIARVDASPRRRRATPVLLPRPAHASRTVSPASRRDGERDELRSFFLDRDLAFGPTGKRLRLRAEPARVRCKAARCVPRGAPRSGTVPRAASSRRRVRPRRERVARPAASRPPSPR